ncbi:MAG: DEAD/DEAH box helicase [archaeon]|nr:DEAD/DEAH box helicase [archaeon]
MADIPDAPCLMHPLIKENTVERRLYQETIIAEAAKKNTLVVLPTGTGKTPVAIGLAAIRLSKYADSKILILAPTKPLVNQHVNSFRDVMLVDEDRFVTITGKDAPEVRAELWKKHQIFFSTPQVVENDLVANRLNLSDFSLVCFDEAHRAFGDYAYTYIARKYMEMSKNPLLLGLTASPGGTKEKIGIICGNLFIENVEIRTDADWDVKKYVKPINIKWVYVELPNEYVRARKYFEGALNDRLAHLQKMHLITSKKVSKKILLDVQKQVAAQAAKTRDTFLYNAMSIVAQCIKINHAIELLQSQGPKQVVEYIEKMKSDQKTKAVRVILSDENFRMAENIINFIIEENIIHPKMDELKRILESRLDKGKKAIVFTQYVKTVDEIRNYVASRNVLPLAFIGQRKGLSQKKQIETLDKFREGEYNCLVATSVAEEGLDIPKVDLVVFYEPIPSEIRSIQRRGRTGRMKEGDVCILIAKGTIDEVYYWSSRHKERKMKSVLKTMKDGFNTEAVTVSKKSVDLKIKKQESLDRYSGKEAVVVYTDTRERKLLRELKEFESDGFELRTSQLEVGDFLLSDRLCIERKRFEDFLQSIIDGRLFSQMKALASNFERPVVVLEGSNLFGQRNIHPNAINGAINSISVDFRIPILWTKTPRETAELIIGLARREQDEKSRMVQVRGERKAQTASDMQEGIVGMLPGVNALLAKRLLSELGSVKKVVCADEERLQKVEGIGGEKAKRIRDVVEGEYE